MCFSNDTTTQTQQTSYTPNPAVAGAATQNLATLQNLQNTGYQPYTGPRVADLTGLQQSAAGVAGATPTMNPWLSTGAGDIQNYTGGPAQTVSASPIYNQMAPYMNQYVQQALAPQIEAQNEQFAGQNKQLDAAATQAGAFGDSRAGIEAANLTNQQNIARTGLLGQAYSNAFNTAIGAGAQDVANSMAAQQATGNFAETALGRQLTGGNALIGAGNQGLNYSQLVANLLSQQGGIQQQQAQANLNVPYSNYLAGQQYPFLTSQAIDQAVSSSNYAMPPSSTSTVQQPNNAGYALLGGVAPALFAGGNAGFGGSAIGGGLGLLLSDEREKENIATVGELDDGTPVKRFNFRADPLKRTQIGLVAQDVEKKRPDAVTTFGNRKYVDYDRATSLESAMGKAA